MADKKGQAVVAPKTSILSKPLSRGRSEVSLSAFAFLFSEIVQYCQGRSKSISGLEKKLAEIGYRVGVRMLELLTFREKGSKRETRLIHILWFINTTVWKALFGKQADGLEKKTGDDEDQYLIHDKDLIINKYISVPKEMSMLNCAAFAAGVVEAVLDGAGYPARVTAHSTEKGSTVLIAFEPGVVARDKALEAR